VDEEGTEYVQGYTFGGSYWELKVRGKKPKVEDVIAAHGAAEAYRLGLLKEMKLGLGGLRSVGIFDDCTVRDEWFIKRSLELRSKMIIIEMSEVQEEQVEQRLFMPALRS
jgi:hypothetical protein